MRFADGREHSAYFRYQGISVSSECQGVLKFLVEMGDPAWDRAASGREA